MGFCDVKPNTFFDKFICTCVGLVSKKVDISRTLLFLHEKLDTMILFLHITELTFIAGSGNPPKLKSRDS
jgi:hypothetical protein